MTSRNIRQCGWAIDEGYPDKVIYGQATDTVYAIQAQLALSVSLC